MDNKSYSINSRDQTAIVEPQCLEQCWMTPGMPDGTYHAPSARCEQPACGWAADSLTSCAGQELVSDPAREFCCLEWFEHRRLCSVQQAGWDLMWSPCCQSAAAEQGAWLFHQTGFSSTPIFNWSSCREGVCPPGPWTKAPGDLSLVHSW